MSGAVETVKRLLRWRRLRWFAFGAVLRYALRRSASRSVERATEELEDRLPAPVRSALDVIPADAVRAGGTALVAGRAARRLAAGTGRASRGVVRWRRQTVDGLRDLRSITDQIGLEAELTRRELKARYLRVTLGDAAADESLLDVRAGAVAEAAPLPPLPEPIRRGRWRAERRLGRATVARVQRSYRPSSKPWDR